MASILLVEDDADTREAVSRFIRNAGHEVRGVVSGRDALAALLGDSPDLVVLDMHLPEMSGLVFLDVIRSYLRWSKLPVIVLTAFPIDDYINRLHKLGVTRIFSKADYHLSDLLKAIEESCS